MNKRKAFLLVTALLTIVFVIVSVRMWQGRPPQSSAPTDQIASTENMSLPEKEPRHEPIFDSKLIQATLDGWANNSSGTQGIAVMDVDGKLLASTNPDHIFFGASIYKLYVAYIGYQKIDDGTYSLEEPYIGNWTRGKCLDEMIRTSNSPCAEKMWLELGKEYLTNKLKSYGLNNTSMTAITTSAGDFATILARLQSGEDLSEQSKQRMLDSMVNQMYRDALPRGFVGLEVYNKVGFREYVEYHDGGIIKFSDGNYLIVAVMTQNVGTKNIATLASDIQSAVEQNR